MGMGTQRAPRAGKEVPRGLEGHPVEAQGTPRVLGEVLGDTQGS